jgi:hypothetical protein
MVRLAEVGNPVDNRIAVFWSRSGWGAESAQTRRLNSIKTPSTLRTLTARGLAPLDSVRLFGSERELA